MSSAVPLNFLCKVPSVYVKISSKSREAFSGEGWGPLVPLLSPRGCPGDVPAGLSELAQEPVDSESGLGQISR